MPLVVRCPACRDKALVDEAARGLTVACPGCGEHFAAVPEVEVVARRPKRNPNRPVRPVELEEPISPPPAQAEEVADSTDHDHDPHRHAAGGLPTSFLVGLALLPFAIPILWLIAPALIGPAKLSIAVPLAIAVSASTLCLAVIYTIDWSPAIRIKGVVMLLALSYFAGASLYFLKPQMVDWLKERLAHDQWIRVYPQEGPKFHAMMPGAPAVDGNLQPVPGIKLRCLKLTHDFGDGDETGPLTFVVGSGAPLKKGAGPEPGTEAWFTHAIDSIVEECNGQLDEEEKVQEVQVQVNTPFNMPLRFDSGRQFCIKLPDDKTLRTVRLFVADGNVYYQSVEGFGLRLQREDRVMLRFFEKFVIESAPPQVAPRMKKK